VETHVTLFGEVVRFTFLSLSIASIYVLVAIGLSIVFGSLKFVNMAHGALYLFGAYVGLFLGTKQAEVDGVLSGFAPLGLNLGFAAALILTPVAVAVIGIAMERLMAKPLYDRDMLDQLLITFGALIFLQEIVAITTGRVGYSYSRPEWASGPLPLPGIGTASRWRIYVIFATLALLAVILLFYKYTDYGLTVRAGTEDAEMTRMLGIRITRPYLLIFAIGAAYAGLAGLMGGATFGIGHQMGIEIIIPALVIVIMGGVGSIRGTIIAALMAGTIFSAVTEIYTSMATASIYILAIVVLTIRPQGIVPSVVLEE
jgi:branched-chain amino acid transport system permease protein